MRKNNTLISVILATMLAPISISAQTSEPEEYIEEINTAWTDTIAVIKDAHNILVTEKGGKATITINGSGSDKDFYYHYAVEPKADTIAAPKEKLGVDIPFAGNLYKSTASMRFIKNVYVGANMPIGPGKGLKSGWEIGVGEVIGIGYTPNAGNTTLSAGFGFNYHSLATSDGLVFAKTGSTLTLAAAPEGVTDISARMDFWQLQFPLLLTQTIAGEWGFNLGVILNLNVSAKGYSRWSVNDLRTKTEISNLHQRFFTPDIFMTVGLRDCIGVYVKYSPLNAMMRYDGPRMSMISTGVNLIF